VSPHVSCTIDVHWVSPKSAGPTLVVHVIELSAPTLPDELAVASTALDDGPPDDSPSTKLGAMFEDASPDEVAESASFASDMSEAPDDELALPDRLDAPEPHAGTAATRAQTAALTKIGSDFMLSVSRNARATALSNFTTFLCRARKAVGASLGRAPTKRGGARDGRRFLATFFLVEGGLRSTCLHEGDVRKLQRDIRNERRVTGTGLLRGEAVLRMHR
jgi:hypothetical protein